MAAADASSASPIEAGEFAALLAACGPFEDKPDIAVAVSGGADSLALTLLLRDWVAARGGRLLALTVDHGLRPESAAEAEGVAEICRVWGIAHKVLAWRGEKPATGLQAAAREARLALLQEACAEAGILHLCLAQHADDQAETFLLRLESGSGPFGLAGMSSVVAARHLRLLRPLLAVAKPRLRATLRRRGVTWFEDPSNSSPAFRRSALRQSLNRLEAAGFASGRFVELAAALAAERAELERGAARLLALAAAILPAGYAWLDPEPLRAAPWPVARQALAALLRTISGAAYAPRGSRLDGLLERVLHGLESGATLSGCRILPRRQGLLVCREEAQAERIALEPGQEALWDGRFQALRDGTKDGREWSLGPLTTEGWCAVAQMAPELRHSSIPGAVRPSLPCLRADGEIAALPQLSWQRSGLLGKTSFRCVFAPKNPLTTAPFTVAREQMHII